MSIATAKRTPFWIVGLIPSAAAVVALSYYLRWPTDITHRFILVAASVALALLNGIFFSTRDKRLLFWAWITGFVFVLAQVGGERLSTIGTLAESERLGLDLTLLLLCAVLLSPAAGGVFIWLCNRIRGAWDRPSLDRQGSRYPRARVFWFCTALLLLCWPPYLAAFYPGLFTYDISYQYLIYKTGEYNTHHPLIHTLMVGVFCDIGRLLFGFPVKGFLLYTITQMTLLAMAMASAISFLYKRGSPKWFCILLLVVDAVMPFNTLMAISSTKDTLFAGSVLYLAVLILELMDDPSLIVKRSWAARFVATQVAVGLMRNNGFVCLLGILLVSLIGLMRYRHLARRVTVLCLCGILLYSLTNVGLKAALQAKDGRLSEAYSVPIQQMSRVYVTTDDPVNDEIRTWLPDAGNYSAAISDMVKGSANINRQNLPQFLGLWLQVGFRHPIVYIDALGHLTKGYLQLDETPPSGAQYLETSFHASVLDMMLPNSQWPWLRDVMQQLYSKRGYLDIPPYSAILSPAFWCWLMLFAFCASICLRRVDGFAIGVMLMFLFFSVLLGPCVMLRYIYPIIQVGPLLIGVLLAHPCPLKIDQPARGQRKEQRARRITVEGHAL